MNGLDPSAGDGGAHHVGVLHIGQRHIADVDRLAPRLLHRVHTDDAITDLRRLHRLAAVSFRHKRPPSAFPPAGTLPSVNFEHF